MQVCAKSRGVLRTFVGTSPYTSPAFSIREGVRRSAAVRGVCD
jgi:hypothetical protein